MWSSSEKSKVDTRQRRKWYLCCVFSASVPSSDPGERELREKREVFLLQCLCLICNRPISLASIPARQLTNGGTLLKLRRTGKARALSHREAFPISQNFWLSYMNRLHGHKFFKCTVPVLFVCSDLIFLHMKACRVACLQATWGYRMHYININKQKKGKAQQRKMIACASLYL